MSSVPSVSSVVKEISEHQNGYHDEFLVFTDPATPVVKKFFKKIDATPQLSRLTEALQQILSSDPEIREVVWKEPL